MMISAVALLLVVAAAAAALIAFHRTGELVTPWTVFLGMAALDIFLPAAVQVLTPDTLLSIGTIDHLGSALAVFTIAALLFACGYGVAGRSSTAGFDLTNATAVVNLRRAEALLLLAAALCVWRIGVDVFRFDSPQTYLTSTLTTRFMPRPMPEGFAARLLFQLAATAPTCAFICIGVLFVHRHAAPIRYGFVWPIVGIFLATTTFFRGTILMYLVGMLALETLRRKELVAGERNAADFTRWSRHVFVVGVAIVVVFVAYGSVRNWMIYRAWGGGDSPVAAVSHEIRQFSAGHGLRGLASIIDQFPSRVPYLEGKTFIDMLLLPVPRTVWASKPAWYGIDDITRAMGWPPTSQSAVTMPGELWANFGPPGVVLMLVYGMFFGVIYASRTGSRLRYIYAFQMVPLTFVAFWMGFTGLMNALVLLPVSWSVLWFVIRPARSPVAAIRT